MKLTPIFALVLHFRGADPPPPTSNRLNRVFLFNKANFQNLMRSATPTVPPSPSLDNPTNSPYFQSTSSSYSLSPYWCCIWCTLVKQQVLFYNLVVAKGGEIFLSSPTFFSRIPDLWKTTPHSLFCPQDECIPL